MAFCAKCGKEISDLADACPRCAYPTPRGAVSETPGVGFGHPGSPLRPLAIGEILELAIRLYRDHAAVLLRAVAIVVVPIQVLIVVLQSSALASNDIFIDSRTLDASAVGAAVLAAMLGAVLGVVASEVATAAGLRAVGNAYLGHAPDAAASVRYAVSRLGSLLWLVVLTSAAVAAIFTAAIVPGLLAVAAVGVPGAIGLAFASLGAVALVVWLFIRWSVAVPVLLVEDIRGTAALRRSMQLVDGRWGSTFAVVAVGVVVSQTVGSFVGGMLTVPVAIVGGPALVQLVLEGAARAVAMIVTLPFVAALVAIVYFDLRVRKEGLDLELLAFGLQDLPPPASPPGTDPDPHEGIPGEGSPPA